MNKNTLLFKFLIALDRLVNVLHGGGFQECISTRAYRRSLAGSWYWTKAMHGINFLFRDKDHCKTSLRWELRVKRDYINDYGSL